MNSQQALYAGLYAKALMVKKLMYDNGSEMPESLKDVLENPQYLYAYNLVNKEKEMVKI